MYSVFNVEEIDVNNKSLSFSQDLTKYFHGFARDFCHF